MYICPLALSSTLQFSECTKKKWLRTRKFHFALKQKIRETDNHHFFFSFRNLSQRKIPCSLESMIVSLLCKKCCNGHQQFYPYLERNLKVRKEIRIAIVPEETNIPANEASNGTFNLFKKKKKERNNCALQKGLDWQINGRITAFFFSHFPILVREGVRNTARQIY